MRHLMFRALLGFTLIFVACGEDPAPTPEPTGSTEAPDPNAPRCSESHACDPPQGCSNALFSNENLCLENGGTWGSLDTEEACDEAGHAWMALETALECEAAGHSWIDPTIDNTSNWSTSDGGASDATEGTPETRQGPTEPDTATPEPTEPDTTTGPTESDTASTEPTESDVSEGDASPIEDSVEEVVAPNEAPVALDDHSAVFAGQVLHIEVRANDTDPNDDALTIVEVSDGAHGSVEITDGGIKVGQRLTYTPNDAVSLGIDTFTYTIEDPEGLQASATVTVNQVAAEEHPVLTILSPQHGDVIEDHTVTISFEAPGCYFTSPSVDEAGCHGHKWLDGEEWQEKEGGGVGHYNTSTFTLGPLTDGIHVFEFILHKNDGTDAPWEPAVTAQVSFEIQGGYVPPVEPIEPVPMTQTVSSMQPAPEEGDLLLATPSGLYRTEGQDAVIPVFFGPTMTALARDPFSVSTYYASGQWPDAGKELWGFATSLNGGESWAETGLVNTAMFEDLAVGTQQTGSVAGVWASQVHVSADSGVTWSAQALTNWVDDLVFKTTDPVVLYLAGPDGIQSMDWGTGEVTSLVSGPVSAIDRVGQQIAYATADAMIHLCDEALSECTTTPSPSTDPVIQLASEMANPAILYLLTATSQVFRSPDGGATWELFVDGGS